MVIKDRHFTASFAEMLVIKQNAGFLLASVLFSIITQTVDHYDPEVV
jgi:hypothetical protein